MKSVHKSVLIWHSAHEMFALVADVPRYPEFLPWCSSGKVLEQHPEGMTAAIGMSFGGLHKSFTTRNQHVPDRRIGFASATLAALVGPVFDKIAGSLVDAFVKRADQVYGT